MKHVHGRGTFPPFPPSFRGRARELRVLSRLLREEHPTALALIGSGGSGKTTLATALGHRTKRFFGGRIHWVRIGDWDATTVAQMMALQLGALGSEPAIDRLRCSFVAAGPSLVVLDNHEDDAVTASVLESLRETPVSWVITARRCLLGGVTVFPVTPALVDRRATPFPSVEKLTRLLRWHPVALDVADALVTNGLAKVPDLERRLKRAGVDRIVPVDHEDDIPEVRAMVDIAMRAVSPAARRMLAVLAASRGDTMDRRTLGELARARSADAAIAELVTMRVVQSPAPGRLALHATIRHAVAKHGMFDRDRYAEHYLKMLEKDPTKLPDEQTHLFALMDWAQERRELTTILRVQDLANRLENRET